MKTFTLLQFCFLIFIVSAQAKTGDTLYVASKVVDVKEKADVSSDTVISVNRGHKLLEISRHGEWVMVGLEKTGGKSGWLAISETSTKQPEGEIERYKTQEFIRFEKAFWVLSNKVEKKTGIELFTDAEYMGDGIVNITATDAWVTAPLHMKKGNMQTLYDMWEASEGTGMHIAIYFYDKKGQLKFVKNSKR
jgi:hypothetical protein